MLAIGNAYLAFDFHPVRDFRWLLCRSALVWSAGRICPSGTASTGLEKLLVAERAFLVCDHSEGPGAKRSGLVSADLSPSNLIVDRLSELAGRLGFVNGERLGPLGATTGHSPASNYGTLRARAQSDHRPRAGVLNPEALKRRLNAITRS